MAKWRDISLNGRTFRSFGFFLKKDTPINNFPVNEVKPIPIEGSVTGGELYKEDEEDIEIPYSFKSIPSKIPYRTEAIFLKELYDWLTSLRLSSSYVKLEDTAKRGCFKWVAISKIDPIIKHYKGCYEFSVTLIGKPYWYLNEGFETISKTFASNAQARAIKVYNPESYIAYPLITITTQSSSGNALDIDTYNYESSSGLINMFKLLSVDEYITIDSEKRQAYQGYVEVAQNHFVDLQHFSTFPFLLYGENVIQFEIPQGSGIGQFRVDIVPRWRCY